MDPRRFLMVAACGLLLSGCALLRPGGGVSPATADLASGQIETIANDGGVRFADVGPDQREALPPLPAGAVPYESEVVAGETFAAPDVDVAAATPGDRRIGEVQVFVWSPGRVFQVRASPLRVTTLTLGPGETILSKAAGDTVRWQIGEAASGEGGTARTHILLKPLQRGLETNLVLTTNRRVYLIDLTSVGSAGYNVAVAWDEAATGAFEDAVRPLASVEPVRVPDPVVMPEGGLDDRYGIEPQGRRPRWTPVSVFNDGRRTFITFDADLQVDEAPALFVVAPDGEAQLANYRQVGGLFIVDRVFDRAELRLGDRRPQIVRLHRLAGGRS